ncbi:SseB family protein [Paracoccus tegillarcae]|uniref:SseB protein N-terminal domain-containing protein n=1 Tax=Paracoccus tegillarcae TaxID=1529068 RepID=A0A2K9EHI4_9RHOB|nr:SseB family protein [Paracoccus tegillarcae]AUH34433.1 hypothetical protein CUV01_14480 [Paracoccus tegillarcae]
MTALDDLAETPFHEADAQTRSRMMSRLADTRLAVALTTQPMGDEIELQMFPFEGNQAALACDTEERLADFLNGPTPYAAMPGRVLAGLLADAGAGLLVNPGHPSQMLLDAGSLMWLRGALAARPEAETARLDLCAPSPEAVAALAPPLAERLGDLRDLITGAALAGIRGERDQPVAQLLLIAGAPEDQQPAIAKALAETLAFLPPQPGGVDISFSDAAPPAGALRFDLTAQTPPAVARPKGPPNLR